MPTTTIEMGALWLRAAVSSANAHERTVDLVFTTGAGVDRVDPMTGQRYIELLEVSTRALDLERLNAGAPLLDSHSAWSVGDILGAVVPGSARIEGGQALARVKFSRRPDVEPVFQDVLDRIITGVSVGYRVNRFEESKNASGRLVRTATSWTPFELSLVSMPADVGAGVRGGQERHRCVIVDADRTADDRARLVRLERARAAIGPEATTTISEACAPARPAPWGRR